MVKKIKIERDILYYYLTNFTAGEELSNGYEKWYENSRGDEDYMILFVPPIVEIYPDGSTNIEVIWGSPRSPPGWVLCPTTGEWYTDSSGYECPEEGEKYTIPERILEKILSETCLIS